MLTPAPVVSTGRFDTYPACDDNVERPKRELCFLPGTNREDCHQSLLTSGEQTLAQSSTLAHSRLPYNNNVGR